MSPLSGVSLGCCRHTHCTYPHRGVHQAIQMEGPQGGTRDTLPRSRARPYSESRTVNGSEGPTEEMPLPEVRLRGMEVLPVVALDSVPTEAGVGRVTTMVECSTFQFAPGCHTHSCAAGGDFPFRLGPKRSADGSGLSGRVAALSSQALAGLPLSHSQTISPT